MNEKALLLLVGGIVALFLLFKFWRIFLQLCVVVGLIIGSFYIYQQFHQSGHGSPYKSPGRRGTSSPSMTSQSAINRVQSYLINVSTRKYEPRKVTKRVRRRCRDYGADVYREECKKRYRTEIKYTYDTVWKTENVEVQGRCRYSPKGGSWNAVYINSSRTWKVVNEGSERGRRFVWDVDDLSGQVSSHQPPC